MISVVIPTYNRTSSLKRCIESIILQYYEGLEVIIVDDGSTDRTGQYLYELKQYTYIISLCNVVNRGVNYSRNRGIEAATKNFILFLDSDDELEEGSLAKILAIIQENLGIRHFLFIVSDRSDDFKNMVGVKKVEYKDWIIGTTSGDFTHVVRADTMKKYLFFEEFRMFEHLNWLRIKRETSPQLLVPVTTALRERNRSDSLTHSSRLSSLSSIRSKFECEKLFYSMYHEDLSLYNPKSVSLTLIKVILLGIACDRKIDCKSLIGYANKIYIKLFGHVILLFPSSIIKYGIISFSRLRRR